MEKDIEENDKIYTIMQIIAKKRGAILSGGRIDDEKISGIILDEFRSGKLGKITLEKANIQEEKLIELIEREKKEVDVNLLSPLTWAYVGDSVYELFIRTHLINKTKLIPHN